MVLKFHHAAVDGGSAGKVMPILLDAAPDSAQTSVAELPPPGRLPGTGEMLLRGLADAARYPLDVMHFQQRTMSRMPHMVELIRPSGRRDRAPRLGAADDRGSPHPIQREAFAKPLLGLWPGTARPG